MKPLRVLILVVSVLLAGCYPLCEQPNGTWRVCPCGIDPCIPPPMPGGPTFPGR